MANERSNAEREADKRAGELIGKGTLAQLITLFQEMAGENHPVATEVYEWLCDRADGVPEVEYAIVEGRSVSCPRRFIVAPTQV
jgi:hypothetical protein